MSKKVIKKLTGCGFFGSCCFALRKSFNLSRNPTGRQTEMIFKPQRSSAHPQNLENPDAGSETPERVYFDGFSV